MLLSDVYAIYDDGFKTLKYNSMFTHTYIHTYIYYSEGKTNLNNKNEMDKHNNKNLIMEYLFIHSLFNVQCQRM